MRIVKFKVNYWHLSALVAEGCVGGSEVDVGFHLSLLLSSIENIASSSLLTA